MSRGVRKDVASRRAIGRAHLREALGFAASVVLVLIALVSTPVSARRPMPDLGRALDARHGLAPGDGDRHLVYFGVSGCGEVCPQTMLTLREVYLRAPEPARLHVTYVELGGKDDGAADAWARAFHPDFEGVSEGSLSAANALAALGVRADERPGGRHTDGVYVLTRAGGASGDAGWWLSSWHAQRAIDVEALKRALEPV